MNQKTKTLMQTISRAVVFLAGLLIAAIFVSLCAYGLWLFISDVRTLPSKWAEVTEWITQNIKESVELLRVQEKETIALWIIGFLFSIWLISSPLICLYWLFKPAEWFWWKHKYVSHTIFFGSFFGCAGVIIVGVHFFLWFFPSGMTGFKARFFLSVAIGIIASFALWHKLTELFEQKRQKDRLDRIKWKDWKLRHDLAEEKKTVAGLRQEMRKLEQLQKEDKLSPFLEAELIALEQVCDKYENPDLGRTTYDNLTDSTPNDYGYDGIDGPIEVVECITEDVFDDCGQSQQKDKAEMSRAQKECLKDFLKTLSRTEKAIVVFYYYDEMTIPEIAKSLKLSPSEVSEMHASIISRCKVYLQEQEKL